jgi:hypothetical protein
VKDSVFWDVMPCGPCKDRRFGGMVHASVVVTANVVHSLPILVTLIMEAIRSSETSVLTKATRHKIPQDGILHSHSEKASIVKPF